MREQGSEEGELWNVLTRLEELYQATGRPGDAANTAARARAIEQKVSAPFDVEIATTEIITTDLKRMELAGCGKVWFRVYDARMLLMVTGSIERARSFGGA